MRRPPASFACLAVYAAVGTLLPGTAARGDEVLHERVFLGSSAGLRCKGGVCSAGDEVRAIEQNGRLLLAPSDGAKPSAGEPVFVPERNAPPPPTPGGPPLPGDPPPERRPQVRMDRETGPESAITHAYHSVFTPSEFPYKRMSALDWANDDESLALFDPNRTPVAIVGADQRRPDYDAFWGSIVVDLEPGRWIPLPSVAPSSRVLDLRTDPPVRPGALELAKDGADNFFIRATAAGGAGGQRRLIWLTDAPQLYFSGPLPDSKVLLGDVPRELVHPLPARLRKVAHGVLDALGIATGPHVPLGTVLGALVAHFRDFETGALPTPSESTYRDLALSKKGVCRHRAYAFTITALAAGLPTRYVENELHVFVEVYLPQQGWRRINLGGAALDDDLMGESDKPAHKPRYDDPLPRPERYQANATPPAKGRERGGPGRGRGDGAGAGTGGTRLDLAAVLEADRVEAGKKDARRATRVSIEVAARVAIRGDTVEVAGRVEEQGGAGAPDLPVEIFLDGAAGAQRIGQTRTGPDGRFVVLALVPPALQLGAYSVVARTPGDLTRRPASSRDR